MTRRVKPGRGRRILLLMIKSHFQMLMFSVRLRPAHRVQLPRPFAERPRQLGRLGRALHRQLVQSRLERRGRVQFLEHVPPGNDHVVRERWRFPPVRVLHAPQAYAAVHRARDQRGVAGRQNHLGRTKRDRIVSNRHDNRYREDRRAFRALAAIINIKYRLIQLDRSEK